MPDNRDTVEVTVTPHILEIFEVSRPPSPQYLSALSIMF